MKIFSNYDSSYRRPVATLNILPTLYMFTAHSYSLDMTSTLKWKPASDYGCHKTSLFLLYQIVSGIKRGHSRVHVVFEFVVTSKHDDSTEGHAEREEHLGGSITPYLSTTD